VPEVLADLLLERFLIESLPRDRRGRFDERSRGPGPEPVGEVGEGHPTQCARVFEELADDLPADSRVVASLQSQRVSSPSTSTPTRSMRPADTGSSRATARGSPVSSPGSRSGEVARSSWRASSLL
jgi:hypothetical protein